MQFNAVQDSTWIQTIFNYIGWTMFIIGSIRENVKIISLEPVMEILLLMT